MSVKSNVTSDFLIIGAGVLGVTVALVLKEKFPDQKIIILEKELHAGFHASGRNSGVLHAGFYYTSDSLKARFCKEGNRAMKDYCKENRLPLNENGKLVVTKNEVELTGLKTLYERGIQNQVSLKLINEKEAKEIEPRVRTIQQAIFSPDTASVDPKLIMQSLVQKAMEQGVCFYFNERYISVKKNIICTSRRKINAGFVVNASGLYADKIAKEFGFGKEYEVVPFKGLYLYSQEKVGDLKTHIYPVPDLQYPFLGVHFTVTVDGKIKIGPTAIPAFWREQYSGLQRFSTSEFFSIVQREAKLFIKNKFHFRQVAIHELKKYQKSFLSNEAAYMLENFNAAHYKTWGKPGIRAQLVNTKTNTLVTDFCYEGDKNSFHILNAVSPAFTCAFPLAEFFVMRIANTQI
ncbi:MAG: hypothetical protein ACD_42C00360G0004 [uncultured bacterium]|nr:MAG: hypothetical protein ACD_42C00360G0004 [uncultured bacterium]OGT25501.1 MAG: FAD-dependent oxidoreductase [Gammaproteobacteria bacterium RIFCSPHIGHO2_02_FULL_42_43]OGT28296.1 MAG: FAD-dependent oxidoreductase [Gammaproteobacteria bacterium RIFCSPHIGHO2_01_FULL_42_8]OGT51453.1 MAG: FAD-dependent oxidoreductase [Gammaproteobacteria bacterium RIFCSPHIGHO2_12_FULL_41_25]OGT62155.1 MAG: FAD-dependent oxidoreductase [Gammaproteobacteria bacterium RIFCSPLOWO2_02_FULL_42_14]OGT85827.1 MAG: FAD